MTFRCGMQGQENVFAFDRAFSDLLADRSYWRKSMLNGMEGRQLYGWIANDDDYASSGPLGDYLRRKFDLKSMTSIVEERMDGVAGCLLQPTAGKEGVKEDAASRGRFLEDSDLAIQKRLDEQHLDGQHQQVASDRSGDMPVVDWKEVDLKRRVMALEGDVQGWQEWDESKRAKGL